MKLHKNIETFEFLSALWPREIVIKVMLRLNKVDQQILSRETGIPASTISMTINRNRSHPKTMAAISQKLGIPVRELFDGKN